MIAQSCATGTLSPYVPSTESPWDKKRVLHFYKRFGFSATSEMVEDALLLSPDQFISSLLDEAFASEPLDAPEWGDWALSQYDQDTINEVALFQSYEWLSKWMGQMMSSNPVKAKMALFWSNHFVTRFDDYSCPSYMYQYHHLLEKYAFGNFKNFTHDIGITPSMLMFLNGVQNTKFQPNENYARELFELFTLGRDNGYTQQDITEAARALTGWNGFSEACAAIEFASWLHDSEEKTIFGRTGNWNYDDLIDILFEERSDNIAVHICSQIYRYFVSADPSEEIINEMATIFKANDFELQPVIRALFLSEHFFDDYVIGNKVKSPLDLLFGFIRSTAFPDENYFLQNEGYNELYINFYFLAAELGQQLFNPVDVAGWEGDKNWVNNNTLSGRWQYADLISGLMATEYPDQFIDFAVKLSDGNLNDAEYITKRIIDHFIPTGLQTEEEYFRATTVFKIEIPENYFQDGSWSLNWDTQIVLGQIYALFRHIVRLPDFQLH